MHQRAVPGGNSRLRQADDSGASIRNITSIFQPVQPPRQPQQEQNQNENNSRRGSVNQAENIDVQDHPVEPDSQMRDESEEVQEPERKISLKSEKIEIEEEPFVEEELGYLVYVLQTFGELVREYKESGLHEDEKKPEIIVPG